jgi:hypothetical protein
MKHLLTAASVIILAACGTRGEHADHQDGSMTDGNPNQALYDKVMDIHDEVMPKMEDIYRLKKELQEKIDGTADMPLDRKKELEDIISDLDSADHLMMDWMHHFNPLPDSVDQEAAREYLETEMEKVMKVRELTNEALDKAKSAGEKK